MSFPAYLAKPHIVYWAYVRSFKDPFLQGYIGVTTQKLHSRVALHFSQPTSPKIREEFEKRGDRIKWRPLHTNLPWYVAYTIERIYRPERDIGWNTAAGGIKQLKCLECWRAGPHRPLRKKR